MLFFAEVYQIQHLRCKDTHFLLYKHQNHQKIIQYSDNQQLYTPFHTISGAKLRNAAESSGTGSLFRVDEPVPDDS